MLFKQLAHKTKRFLKILFGMEQDLRGPTSCGSLSQKYIAFVRTLNKLKLCDLDETKLPLCGRDRLYETDTNFGCKKLCDFRYAHELQSKKKS